MNENYEEDKKIRDYIKVSFELDKVIVKKIQKLKKKNTIWLLI